MSKFVILGLAGALALGALAVLPQISIAAVTAGPAARYIPTVDASASGTTNGADALADAGYRTCFMKRSVVFTSDGPKRISTRSCPVER